MIFTYEALKGGGYSLLGSLFVHLAMLVATWICLDPMTNDSEYIEELHRPRNLMYFFTMVHLLSILV